jgi:hypothetical protein
VEHLKRAFNCNFIYFDSAHLLCSFNCDGRPRLLLLLKLDWTTSKLELADQKSFDAREIRVIQDSMDTKRFALYEDSNDTARQNLRIVKLQGNKF